MDRDSCLRMVMIKWSGIAEFPGEQIDSVLPSFVVPWWVASYRMLCSVRMRTWGRPGAFPGGQEVSGSRGQRGETDCQQNAAWYPCPARIIASTAVPNEPPTCCMMRVLVLASGTLALGSSANARVFAQARAAPQPLSENGADQGGGGLRPSSGRPLVSWPSIARCGALAYVSRPVRPRRHGR